MNWRWPGWWSRGGGSGGGGGYSSGGFTRYTSSRSYAISYHAGGIVAAPGGGGGGNDRVPCILSHGGFNFTPMPYLLTQGEGDSGPWLIGIHDSGLFVVGKDTGEMFRMPDDHLLPVADFQR